MALKASHLRSAAGRVSSDVPALSRSSAGDLSPARAWYDQQSLVARSIVADPDLVSYFAYLASNRACRLAQDVAAELSAVAVAAEGLSYVSAEVPKPSRLASALAEFDYRTNVTRDDVTRLARETDEYVRSHLLPQITHGGRTQVRRDEARGSIATLERDLARDWWALRECLTDVSSARHFTPDIARDRAVRTPLNAMRTTAPLLDTARLTDFTVQLAASAAAVSAMGRAVDLRIRLRVGKDDFPGDIRATPVLDGGRVTAVTLDGATAAALGVRSGDEVRWNAGTARVRAVSGTTLTLRDSTILVDGGVLQVLSAPHLAWESCADIINDAYVSLPGRDAIVSALRTRMVDDSAARVRSLVEYLVTLANAVGAASGDALEVLARVGGQAGASASPSLATALRAFAPNFSTKTRGTGEALLRGLEERGFDGAVDMLYRGDVDALLTQGVDQASRFGRVGTSASMLGRLSEE